MVLLLVISCLYFCHPVYPNSGFTSLYLFPAMFSSLFLVLLKRNYLVSCQDLCRILPRFLLFLEDEFDRIGRSQGSRFLWPHLCLLMLFLNFFDLTVMTSFLFFDTLLVLEIIRNYCLFLVELISIVERRDYHFVDFMFGSCFSISRICCFDLFIFFRNYLSEYMHEALLHYAMIEKYHRY